MNDKKAIESLFALLLGLSIAALGVWVGIFVMLIPGIVEVISQFQAERADAYIIAVGLVKIFLSRYVLFFLVIFGLQLPSMLMRK